MVVHAVVAPQRQGVVAVGTDVAVDDDGARGLAVDGKLVGGGGLDGGAVVVVDVQSADDAVVGTFLQDDGTGAYGLSVVLLLGHLAAQLGNADDGAVALFAHEHDVGTVDDDLLLVQAFLDENLIGRLAVYRCVLDGLLDALSGLYDGVEEGFVDDGFAEHDDGAVLVSALGGEADGNLVLRVVLVGPLVVDGIECCQAVEEPAVAVAPLVTNLFQSATGNAVAVADERLAALQVVVARP